METRAKDPRYRIEPQGGEEGGLPLVIQPRGDARVGRLCEWLRERPDWVQDRLTTHGAPRFAASRSTAVRTSSRWRRSAASRASNPTGSGRTGFAW